MAKGLSYMFDKSAQQGFLLLEFIVLIAVTLALSIWGVNEWSNRLQITQAQSLANWMLIAKNGVQTYMDQNYEEIITAVNAMGESEFDLRFKPDWQQLKAHKFIPNGWQELGPLRHKLGLHISRVGNCDDKACLLQALLYTTKPITDKYGSPDQTFIANWLQASNSAGMVLWDKDLNTFKGYGLNLTSPVGVNLASGTLALYVINNVMPSQAPENSGTDLDLENYLQIGDKRNPNFQGPVAVTGAITTKSRVTTDLGLVIKASKEIYTSCSTNGEINLDKKYPGLLVCTGGSWRSAATSRGGGYVTNTKRGCKNVLGQSTANSVTGQCSCPFMHNAQIISESGSMTDPNGLSLGYICLPN